MKKSLLALLIVTPIAFCLHGCVIKINDDGAEYGIVSDSEKRTYKNRRHISSLHLGTSITDIQQVIGVADFSEAYTSNTETVKVLYYRTQRKHKDGLTTKDECSYLQFINGELVATGLGDEFHR